MTMAWRVLLVYGLILVLAFAWRTLARCRIADDTAYASTPALFASFPQAYAAGHGTRSV
jgi:hypothetical protein